MKKIALSLAVVATMAMVSCGNKAAENTDSVADTTVAVEEVVADSTDTAVVAAAEETVAPAEAAPAADAPAADAAAPAADSAAAK